MKQITTISSRSKLYEQSITAKVKLGKAKILTQFCGVMRCAYLLTLGHILLIANDTRCSQAVIDVPCCLFADELIVLAAYPNAKVILTTRDPDAWLASMNHSFGKALRFRGLNMLEVLDWVSKCPQNSTRYPLLSNTARHLRTILASTGPSFV